MNLRPSGYEPDELPDCSTPRYKWCLEPESNRHGTKYHRILSPVRLPIPPSRHLYFFCSSRDIHYNIIHITLCQTFFLFFLKNFFYFYFSIIFNIFYEVIWFAYYTLFFLFCIFFYFTF